MTTTAKVKDNYLKAVDNVLLDYNTAYKYETPYTGPFVITQCFTNGTVNLKCGPEKIGYNIRQINPYKSDTKVEDISSKICLMMSAYDRQLYTLVLTTKAWKQAI